MHEATNVGRERKTQTALPSDARADRICALATPAGWRGTRTRPPFPSLPAASSRRSAPARRSCRRADLLRDTVGAFEGPNGAAPVRRNAPPGRRDGPSEKRAPLPSRSDPGAAAPTTPRHAANAGRETPCRASRPSRKTNAPLFPLERRRAKRRPPRTLPNRAFRPAPDPSPPPPPPARPPPLAARPSPYPPAGPPEPPAKHRDGRTSRLDRRTRARDFRSTNFRRAQPRRRASRGGRAARRDRPATFGTASIRGRHARGRSRVGAGAARRSGGRAGKRGAKAEPPGQREGEEGGRGAPGPRSVSSPPLAQSRLRRGARTAREDDGERRGERKRGKEERGARGRGTRAPASNKKERKKKKKKGRQPNGAKASRGERGAASEKKRRGSRWNT